MSGSCGTTCARSLYVVALVQDLAQDLCVRILWTTCIRICYEDTCARSLYQDLVGSLLSGSYRTTSARSLSDPFGPLYQDPVGQLVQDLCFRISV